MIHYIFMKETHQSPRQQILNQFYFFHTANEMDLFGVIIEYKYIK